MPLLRRSPRLGFDFRSPGKLTRRETCSSPPATYARARSGSVAAHGDWAYEVKWGGFRAIVSTEGAPLRVRPLRRIGDDTACS
jgi:hypothetical protein